LLPLGGNPTGGDLPLVTSLLPISLPIKPTTISQWAFLLRASLFLSLLLGTWLPIAIPIYLLYDARDPNGVSIAVMSLLFAMFLGLLPLWGRRIYFYSSPWYEYGLRSPVLFLSQIARGWGIGFLFILCFLGINLGMGWAIWQIPNSNFSIILFEGTVVGIGVAFAEELFFRGWLLNELERDYAPKLSLSLNATIFALLHFLKPLPEAIRTFPQFPALVLLGLALVWARRGSDRSLGMAIGLHGGLVGCYYWLNVGGLIKELGTAPSWLTGIDGNPLAGLVGIGLLAILAIAMAYRSRSNCSSPATK
jgi:membrane protease YdiL (CAAX protease family)